MMKLNVFKVLSCVIHSVAGIVLSLFLVFDDFEPRCSYKIVPIKKTVLVRRWNLKNPIEICSRVHLIWLPGC